MILNIIGTAHDWTLDLCELFHSDTIYIFFFIYIFWLCIVHSWNVYQNPVPVFQKLSVYLLQRQNCKHTKQYSVIGVMVEIQSAEKMQRTLPGGFLKGFTDEGAFAPGLKGWLGVHQGEGNGTPLQYFAWRIPWMEEPGGLQSMGSLRVGHDWATSLSLFTFMHWRRKWQPTPVFLPGESQGRGSLVGCHLWGHTESDTTEVT